MNRFLIRGSVRCHNLASRVQGMAVRGIAEDFMLQYGYRPWLLEIDCNHFEQYVGRGLEENATEQLGFLRQHVPV